MDELERQIRQRLKDDFDHYAGRCLRIIDKDGKECALTLNRAQRYVHTRLEQQLAELGKVRALILKGRQQGCSTYVGGRYYWKVTHRRGARCYILTHEDPATQNLFGMVKRYHDNMPGAVKPTTGAANANELKFALLDGGYRVGTAGAKATGRSQTLQLFHGSEVAFWPHAETHAAGVMQAIADAPGTEVILESTANGIGNFFHKKWQEAERGGTDYQAIFVPWFWQDEYRKDPPPEFTLDDNEREYAARTGCDDAQMCWRRQKTSDLNNDPSLFMQEYPATAAEAFQNSGHDAFIPAALVARARKFTAAANGPLVIGFDPAWTGNDRHALARRRGRKLIKVEYRKGLDTMGAAGWLKQVIDAEAPARVFIDVGGVGAGVYDRLSEMGYGDIVAPINFGSAPLEPPLLDELGKGNGGPANRRAEIWLKSKQWLEDPAGADIPDEDVLQADACGPSYKYDSSTRLLLEKKEDMRRRGVISPDGWDAVALTFAEPVGSSRFNRRIDYPDMGYA